MTTRLAGVLMLVASSCLAVAETLRPGQFMVIPFRGTEAPLELLARYRPAGVILFAGNLEGDPARLIADLRAFDPELLIMIDQEGGPFMSYRTPEVTRFPSAMALGAADDVALAEAVGKAIGQQLCTLGVDVNLAPVLDLNVNPENPIIGLRSFGSNPHQAGALALGFARGLAQAGVLATAKHFPGHGDTDVDSHLGLPVVDKPLDALLGLELLPFKAAIAAGIPLIMTAHILYPQLDPHYPATLSPTILGGLLRGQLGFDGLIITDDIAMRAIRDHYGVGEAAVLAVQAGVDLVLVGQRPGDPELVYTALKRALETGAISAVRYQETAARLAAVRARQTLECQPELLEQAPELALEVARRSVTWLDGPLPIPGEGTLVVAPRITARYGEEPSLADLAPSYLPGSIGWRVGVHPSEAEIAEVVALAAAAERIVLGTYHWLGTLPEAQVALYRALIALGKPVYVVALGNPTDLLYLPVMPSGYLASYGYREVQLRAVLEVLAGTVVPTGRLPVPVGLFPNGAGGMALP